MSYESRYWKDHLLKIADSLEKRGHQRRWTEASFARIERDVVVCFYLIRKLIQDKKISDSIASQKIALRYHPRKGSKRMTIRNSFDIDDFYDLEGILSEQRDLSFLCNLFVHSRTHLKIS